MKLCSTCGATYSDRVDFCFSDGSPLVANTSPEDAPIANTLLKAASARADARAVAATYDEFADEPKIAGGIVPVIGDPMDTPMPGQGRALVEAPPPRKPDPSPAPAPAPNSAAPPSPAPRAPATGLPPVVEPVRASTTTGSPRPQPEPEPEERRGLLMFAVGGAVVLALLIVAGIAVVGGSAVIKGEIGTPAPPPVAATPAPRPPPPPAMPPAAPVEAVEPDPLEAAAVEPPLEASPELAPEAPPEVAAVEPAPVAPAPVEAAREPAPAEVAAVAPPAEVAPPAVAAPAEGADPSPWDAPAATTAKVTITSTPPGADVYVQGKLRGVAPVTLVLDAETYAIAVEMEGYERTQMVLPIKADLEVPFTLQPKARTGRLMVVLPGRDGDMLLIDGAPIGPLPATAASLVEGRHTFTVEGAAGTFQVTHEVRFDDQGKGFLNLQQ